MMQSTLTVTFLQEDVAPVWNCTWWSTRNKTGWCWCLMVPSRQRDQPYDVVNLDFNFSLQEDVDTSVELHLAELQLEVFIWTGELTAVVADGLPGIPLEAYNCLVHT